MRTNYNESGPAASPPKSLRKVRIKVKITPDEEIQVQIDGVNHQIPPHRKSVTSLKIKNKSWLTRRRSIRTSAQGIRRRRGMRRSRALSAIKPPPDIAPAPIASPGTCPSKVQIVKFIDCIDRESKHTELIVVQHGYASRMGFAERDRNRQALQAVYSTTPVVAGHPHRNWREHIDMFDQKRLRPIMMSLGFQSPAGEYACPYGKIILVTDERPRGQRVRHAILEYCRRANPKLIAEGRLFEARAPNWSKLTVKEFAATVLTVDTRRLTVVA